MRKNENSDKKKDYVISGMFYSLWGFIILFCMLLFFATTGHCASEQDYFPMFQNQNGNITQYVINFINSDTDIDTENNYVVSGKIVVSGNYTSVYVATVPKSSNIFYAEKHNDLQTFSYYLAVSGSSSGLKVWEVKYRTSNPSSVFKNNATSGGLTYFVNCTSSNYSSSVSYISNLQVMTNNTSSAQVVLFYDDGVTIPDGDTARDDMEKPDIDDYIPSWTNRPTFDGSSVENALSSIWDITIWTAENTRDTIKGVGQFIGDTLRWTSQKIIDSIRGKIDELKTGIVNAINNVSAFVQDIKGFVSDIKDFTEYVAEPLDVSSVQNTITGSTAFGDVSTITGAFADFKGVFDTTSEPSEYKIPFHLESIPILNQTQAQYIDLSVISNQRGLIRAFCWVVTTFSLFVTVVDALPNYLKGGDE